MFVIMEECGQRPAVKLIVGSGEVATKKNVFVHMEINLMGTVLSAGVPAKAGKNVIKMVCMN